MNNTSLARALFDAFTNGDLDMVRSLCAPGLRARRNLGEFMDLETLLAGTSAILSVVSSFRYEDINCIATETGFVEEHRVCATLPDGETIAIAAVVIAVVADGTITELSEVVDGAAAAPLFEALAA